MYRSRKYNVNEQFFNFIDSEKQAYILGYFFADGCVSPPYRISVSSKDLEQLELVNNLLESNYPINKRCKNINNKICIYYELVISSKNLVKDIIQYGCVKRKSYENLHIPSIKSDLIRHFIRGYFDGDGGVRVDSKENLCINFVGCQTILSEIQKILELETKIKHTKLRNHSSIFRFEYHGNTNAKKIRDYLYDNSLFFLRRKQNIFFSKNPKYDKK